ncbi:thermonuclease family protein [Singulisphaera sp. PoT]|uniref:thermonuclease family protein n=1 Tax=Singulisphaera sp. PoT TaxID=3411797 RepID=UPI003BF48D1E
MRGGWAWWYDAYAKFDGELKRLEDEARAARRGLWADKAPTPPWDWRKGGAAVQAAGFIGNSRSRLYHAANCNAAAKMTASHRVALKRDAEAEQAGYRKAKDCH